MLKLTLQPTGTNYSIDENSEVVRVRQDGGGSRYRRDFIGAARRVTCTWQCKPSQYEYMQTFFSAINRGASSFLIDLAMDTVELVEHTAHIMPGSFNLRGKEGNRYTVTALLEVIPKVRNEGSDAAWITVTNAYGDNASMFASTLATLANVNVPAIFPNA